MIGALPSMRELAQGLVIATPRVPTAGPHGPLLVNDDLRMSLRRTMGANGYAVLLRRTLALVAESVPELGAAHVDEDGRIEGLEPGFRENDALWHLSVTAVTTQLIELLAGFLGESLTRRIVREACLDMAPGQPMVQPASSRT